MKVLPFQLHVYVCGRVCVFTLLLSSFRLILFSLNFDPSTAGWIAVLRGMLKALKAVTQLIAQG